MLRRLAAATFALGLVALAGCGGPADTPTSSSAAGGPTSPVGAPASSPAESMPAEATPAESTEAASVPAAAACNDVLSDEVMEAFGWKTEGPARPVAQGCSREGEPGVLLRVKTRTNSFYGTDRAGIEQQVNEKCETMASSGREVDTALSWLTGDPLGCYQMLSSGTDTGLGELYVMSDKPSMLEIRFGTNVPTTQKELRAGLNMIVINGNRYL